MDAIINDFSTLFGTVLSVLNPIGGVTLFLALTAGYSPEKLKSISTSCAIAVFVGLSVSAFLGTYILDFFSISIDSFRIGGGVLIAINALSMVKGKLAPAKLNKNEILKQKDTESIGIVPLAIPLMVGPGTISSVILHTKSYTSSTQWITALVVFLLLAVVVYLSQLFAKAIKRVLGEVGVNVMTRIMGLILIAIGSEYIITGIKGSFGI